MRISKRRIYSTHIFNSFSGISTGGDTFRFGIKLKGGLGDILVGINYLNYIVKTLPKENIIIDVYAHRNLQLVASLLPADHFINGVYLDDAISDNGNDKYDLFVVLNRYPDVRRKNIRGKFGRFLYLRMILLYGLKIQIMIIIVK